MTDPAVVALALSRLADQSAPHRPDHRVVVADAEAAFRDVEDAADFLECDGETRLREAVAAAERWGDDAVAARGEALLATLKRYRTAALGDPTPRTTAPRATRPTTTTAADDQFHPPRTTPLGGDGIPTDR